MAAGTSVIIPCYEEARYLPALIDCLHRQTTRDFEIIVADAGSSDRTREVAIRGGGRVVTGGNPAAGRNAGARAALGRWLLFLDADVKIAPRFLERGLREMRRRHLRVATCKAVPHSILTLDYIIQAVSNVYISIQQYTRGHLPGYCIFIARDLFEQVGGFDESIVVGEDHEFGARVSEYAAVRVLSSVRVGLSVRRYRQEGRLAYIKRAVGSMLRRAAPGDTNGAEIPYDFGRFGDSEPINYSESDRTLRRYERIINRFDRRLQRLLGGPRSANRRGHSD